MRAALRIKFEEAVFGCEKDLTLNLKEVCSKCHGTGAKPGTTPVTCTRCGGKGQVTSVQQSIFGTMSRVVTTCPDCNGTGRMIKDKCPDCYGTGYVSNRKTLKITVPAGIDDGQSIRLSGKGEPGRNGGDRGDLLVEINVMSHPIFQRQDYNLYSTAPISFAQAALGGDVRITTIDGDVLFPIKAGTQTDTRIRLKGKGVPSLRNKNLRGDHYVTLIVQVPEKLSAAQREALIAFDKAMGGEATKEEDEPFDGIDESSKKKGGWFGKKK